MEYLNPIRVEIETEYLESQSRPANKQFAFAYHITIKNNGDRSAQLLSRHWIIVDGDQKKQNIQGDGVVGQQPNIPPGGSYSYTSSCILPTPVGCMQGSYLMLGEEGEQFRAEIPLFSLQVPGIVN